MTLKASPNFDIFKEASLDAVPSQGSLFHQPSGTTPIRPIDSMAEIQEELFHVGEQTVIVFDVDGTLVESFNAGLFIFYDSSKVPKEDEPFMSHVQEELRAYSERVGVDQKRDLINSFLMGSTEKELVETCVPEMIQQLQARNIKIIGCTGCPAGAFGSVTCGRTLRYNGLRRLGIDFSSTYALDELTLDTLTMYHDDPPMYYKGMLHTNWKNSKGAVLSAFFDYLRWPQEVVIIDDKREAITSVQTEMEKHSVLCRGYLYQGVQRHPMPAFDRKIAEVQLDYLIHRNQLLTATQVATMIAVT